MDNMDSLPTADTLAHHLVSAALESHSEQLCHALEFLLSRVDRHHRGLYHHCFDEELERLEMGDERRNAGINVENLNGQINLGNNPVQILPMQPI